MKQLPELLFASVTPGLAGGVLASSVLVLVFAYHVDWHSVIVA